MVLQAPPVRPVPTRHERRPLCLNCATDLHGVPDDGRTVECSACGMEYAVELLDTRDAVEWERIRTERLLCWHYGYEHEPVVHAGPDGKAIRCPERHR